MVDKQIEEVASNSPDASSRYVWDGDALLPSSGEVELAIGELLLTFDLSFPHERRYALGLLYAYRNPQADIDRQLFQKYVRPGDVVLDAGANIGVSAADALACGASHVICVEPERTLSKRLEVLKSSSQNRISVLHCALGAQQGFAELLLSRPHNQGHTISSRMTTLFPHLFDGTVQEVEVSTIDVILGSKPTTIWKLDVEGMEADAIRGARQTLERCPPRIIIAELYDPFVDEVITLLPEFQVRRVGLARSDYNLQLLDQIGGALMDEFCPTSPTYVFTRHN